MPNAQLSQEQRERHLAVIESLRHRWHKRNMERHKGNMEPTLGGIRKGPSALKGKHALSLRRFKKYLQNGIKNYTGRHYEAVNTFLRTGEKCNWEKRTGDIIQFSKTALAMGLRWTNLPLKVCEGNNTLYRGSGEIPGVRLEVGGTFCDKAFFSTTVDESVAKRFLGSMICDFLILFKIVKHWNGIDVSKYSQNKSESEVLFAPGTMFRIMSVYEDEDILSDGNVKVVVMQEMV